MAFGMLSVPDIICDGPLVLVVNTEEVILVVYRMIH